MAVTTSRNNGVYEHYYTNRVGKRETLTNGLMPISHAYTPHTVTKLRISYFNVVTPDRNCVPEPCLILAGSFEIVPNRRRPAFGPMRAHMFRKGIKLLTIYHTYTNIYHDTTHVVRCCCMYSYFTFIVFGFFSFFFFLKSGYVFS